MLPIRSVLVLALLAISGSASAFYASPTFPERWGGSPGSWTFNPPGGWSGGAAGGSVSQSIGGRSINIPFSARMAGNAGAAVASAIRITPGGIATAAVAAWLLPYAIKWVEDAWQKEESTAPGASIYYWQGSFGGAACRASVPSEALMRCSIKLQNNVTDAQLINCVGPTVTTTTYTGSCKYAPNGNTLSASGSRVTACVAPQVWVNGTCQAVGVTYRDPTEQEWAQPAAQTVPDQVANDVGKAIPVGLPTLNPDAQGQPQPQRVPVGAPQAVPGTSPQEYRQPVVDVVPAPLPDDPFRVDVQPKEIIGTDPVGQTEPAPVPSENPPPAVTPEQIQLCEAYPDIAACQPLGKVDDVPVIPTDTKQLEIEPYGGFGPSTAACPAPRTVSLRGGTFSVSMPFDLLCDFADGIRPIVVGLAWLASVLAWLGLSRKD